MKYYTGEGLKKEFNGYKIESINGIAIQDNNIYTPTNYNYYQNSIEVKKIHTYLGTELLTIFPDRVTFNINIINDGIYHILHLNRTGWTKEHYPIYFIEVEKIIL